MILTYLSHSDFEMPNPKTQQHQPSDTAGPQRQHAAARNARRAHSRSSRAMVQNEPGTYRTAITRTQALLHHWARATVRRALAATRRIERSLELLDDKLNKRRSAHVPLILRDALRIAKSIPRLDWPPRRAADDTQNSNQDLNGKPQA